MIRTRRLYDPEESAEGYRVLVDRLWPRGISKEKAGWDKWMRDVAPSDQLRKWYNHDPGKWQEFKQFYKKELSAKQDLLSELLRLESEHKILTLLYSSKEKEINNAAALREFLIKGSLTDQPSTDK